MNDIDFHRVAVRDLSEHLDQRILTVLQDYMDRCNTCGISYEDATTLALTVLGHHFVAAAGGIGATNQEITATCLWHYERLKEREHELKRFTCRQGGA